MTTATLSINLDAICANWAALDALSGAGVTTAAVVKANAYGLDTARVVRALSRAGANVFFVAATEEAGAVREAAGDEAEICVFSGHMAGDSDAIHDLRLIPMLNSIAQLTRHFEALPEAPFGIQLDTGMNRLGLEANEWDAVRAMNLPIPPTLLISHLACADEPDHPMNTQQLSQFCAMTNGMNIPRSLSATGGILLGDQYHFDLTRPGIGLYGGAPFADAYPVVHISLPVIQTRDITVGESVGYGNSWVAERPSKIATVAAGYADGLLRSLSGNTRLWADDTPCPVVGRVSMDMIGVDITDLPRLPKALDIICPHQGIDDLARDAGTIGYEILTSLGARYNRRYYSQ